MKDLVEELSKYSSDELRAELRRRSLEKRRETMQARRAEPKFIRVTGTVTRVMKCCPRFQNWSYQVQIDDEFVEKYNIDSWEAKSYFRTMKMLKRDQPREGDKVVITQKINKYFSRFYVSSGYITEVVERAKQSSSV